MKSLWILSWFMDSIVSWIYSSGLRPHLTVQSTDLLLVGRGQEEATHLPFQRFLHLHIYVIARCLLLV
ncbi:mCG1050934 [Mus musculus]|nr:mCG1050934 [Mus musculus]